MILKPKPTKRKISLLSSTFRRIGLSYFLPAMAMMIKTERTFTLHTNYLPAAGESLITLVVLLIPSMMKITHFMMSPHTHFISVQWDIIAWVDTTFSNLFTTKRTIHGRSQ